MGEPFEPGEGKDALGITVTRYSLRRDESGFIMGSKPPGFLTQTLLLFQREILNLRRDTHAVAARYGISIFMGILIGVIFLNVGKSDPTVPSNLQSHFGALVMVTLTSMFGTAQPALLAFPSERPVFLREYSTNHYGVASYFISKLTMEASLTALQVLLQSLILYYSKLTMLVKSHASRVQYLTLSYQFFYSDRLSGNVWTFFCLDLCSGYDKHSYCRLSWFFS